jgi:hypothetical protein
VRQKVSIIDAKCAVKVEGYKGSQNAAEKEASA